MRRYDYCQLRFSIPYKDNKRVSLSASRGQVNHISMIVSTCVSNHIFDLLTPFRHLEILNQPQKKHIGEPMRGHGLVTAYKSILSYS